MCLQGRTAKKKSCQCGRLCESSCFNNNLIYRSALTRFLCKRQKYFHRIVTRRTTHTSICELYNIVRAPCNKLIINPNVPKFINDHGNALTVRSGKNTIQKSRFPSTKKSSKNRNRNHLASMESLSAPRKNIAIVAIASPESLIVIGPPPKDKAITIKCNPKNNATGRI